MTKRNNIFEENTSKKLKLEETNLDALWGEDLNPDDVEDCLLLASQVCEQKNPGPIQRNNVSILPNYSFFQQNDIFTSTQCNNNKPTTSNGISNQTSNLQKVNTEELQIEIKKLKAEFTNKEGEISILREQLKQVRLNLTGEHQKKEQEWTEKIQMISKELLSTKSDLDFKNLEVVNLKHRISEVTKHGDVALNGILNFSQSGDNKIICDVGLKLNNFSGEVLVYPLRHKIDGEVFNLSKTEHFYDFNLNLNKFNVQDEQKICEQYKASNEYNQFKFEDLFSYISILLNCSNDDLNSNCYNVIIDKIFSGALQLMKNFLKNLNVLEQDVQEDTIRQRDRIYLDSKQEQLCKNSSIFGNEEWYKNEIGIKCRRLIAVLSTILPYSSHLRKLIFQRSINNEDFFTLLKSAIKIIGVLRISEKCTGYLSSIVLFMTNITLTNEFSELHHTVKEIIKEIIFTRPTIKTLEYICKFLKQSVLNEDFVHKLCIRTSQRSYSRSSDQLVLCCTEESCLLNIFALIYKERFSKNEELQNTSVLDLIKFLNNLFDYNVEWMYYNSANNDCNCLRKIVEIGIEIIHKRTKSFSVQINKNQSNQECLEEYKLILKSSINFLHLIKFKCVDVFNKQSIFCKYKFILKTLMKYFNELELNDQENNILKELNHCEEKKNIDESIINKIPIWK